MNSSFLSDQKIGKRKYYGVCGTMGTGEYENSAMKPAVKPRKKFSRKASVRKPPKNSGLLPAGTASLHDKNSRFIDEIRQEPAQLHKRKYPRKIRNKSENIWDDQSRPPSRVPSFSIPVIPVAALFLLTMGILFAVSNDGLDFGWLGRNVINPESDSISQYNLALYTGVRSEEASGDGSVTIPLDMAEVFAWQSYKVKRGDTVSQIALDYSVSMDAIIASNGISNVRVLREGETLRIPNMDGIPYTVKNGDSLSGISTAMGVPVEAILDANDLETDIINAGLTLFIPGARMNKEDLKLALGDLFIYPVKGARLSSPFGWRNDPFTGVRRHHAAVDLSAPQGTPVWAAMAGKVSIVGNDLTYGNYIIITHSGGYQTMYAHLHTTSVKQNEQVAQGKQIGTVGTTGYSTGPHLHFAVYKNGRAVNPLDLLNQ
jgi:murein DD-endopeptidase MepM/ murein hydrolase activator NlpD